VTSRPGSCYDEVTLTGPSPEQQAALTCLVYQYVARSGPWRRLHRTGGLLLGVLLRLDSVTASPCAYRDQSGHVCGGLGTLADPWVDLIDQWLRAGTCELLAIDGDFLRVADEHMWTIVEPERVIDSWKRRGDYGYNVLPGLVDLVLRDSGDGPASGRGRLLLARILCPVGDPDAAARIEQQLHTCDLPAAMIVRVLRSAWRVGIVDGEKLAQAISDSSA